MHDYTDVVDVDGIGQGEPILGDRSVPGRAIREPALH
jgi:hypothetical protein